MSTSKNDLSLFPLFIFLKPSRLRRIPVGVLFRRTVDHFGNGWQVSPVLWCQHIQDRKWKTPQRNPSFSSSDIETWYRKILEFEPSVVIYITSASSANSLLSLPFFHFISWKVQWMRSKFCHCSKHCFPASAYCKRSFLESGDRSLWRPPWCYESSRSPDTVWHQLGGCGYDKPLVQTL